MEKELAPEKENNDINERLLSPKSRKRLKFRLRPELKKIEKDIEALQMEGGQFSKDQKKDIQEILDMLEGKRTEIIEKFIDSMTEKNEEIVEKIEERKEKVQEEIDLRGREEEDHKRKIKENELRSRKQIVSFKKF